MQAKVLIDDLHLSERIATSRANKLLEFLGSRGGVFRAFSYHCEWLHPTFREYLTAEAFADDASEKEIDELLAKCNDVAWRQVILFFIAVRSEKESVISVLHRLKSIAPPEGLTVTAAAIAEGANVEEPFVQETVEDLCQAIQEASKGDLCERLLFPGNWYMEKLRRALKPFMQMRDVEGPIADLKNRLARSARDFGRNRSSAIEELEKFGAIDTLTEIARDGAAATSVRADAAKSLCALAHVTVAYEAFVDIAKLASGGEKQWSVFAGLLAGTEDPKLLGVIANKALISDAQWHVLLGALNNTQKKSVLSVLLNDQTLAPARRLAARLEMMDDVEQAKELLPTLADRPADLKACVNVLARNNQSETLLNVVLSRESDSNVCLVAFRGLGKLKREDDLVRIVESDQVPYRVRRMAAEALYGLQISDKATAILLRFFDAQRNCERPKNLIRRAFLNYKLNQNEEALRLLDQAFTSGGKSAWALGVYAHCLQRLGKIEEALPKYTEALDLNRYASFERCQRAFLYWTQGELGRALEDVQQTGAYTDQKWFLPYGAEILWKGGRLKEARDWLDAAVKEAPESNGLPLLLRGLFRFHQGLIKDSISDFQELINLKTTDVWDSFYLSTRRNMPKALRVSGALDEAIVEYSKQIERLWAPSVCYERAETRLRKGDVGKADQELNELRAAIPDRPSFVYLDGLCKCFQGNKEALYDAATRAIALTADDGSAQSMSDMALYKFAIDHAEAAEGVLDKLVADSEFDQLRYHTVFNLDTLALALPEHHGIASARDRLKKIAWPEGWDPNPILVALRNLSRGKYPFPMYCQLRAIAGLEKDKELGERILNSKGPDERSIVLWKLDQPNRLYGQCNFKKDPDADYQLKFCDSFDRALAFNLPIFVREFKVRRLLFLEPDLLAIFNFAVTAKRLPVTCELIEKF